LTVVFASRSRELKPRAKRGGQAWRASVAGKRNNLVFNDGIATGFAFAMTSKTVNQLSEYQ